MHKNRIYRQLSVKFYQCYARSIAYTVTVSIRLSVFPVVHFQYGV